jgi:hypothetical protein
MRHSPGRQHMALGNLSVSACNAPRPQHSKSDKRRCRAPLRPDSVRTMPDVQTVGEDLRIALDAMELQVREGEDEIARQRAVIHRAARTHQNTAPHEARLVGYLHVHAARVTERHRLQGELGLWLANQRRSMRENQMREN